jgi:peptidoglycan/xylan/chitin deacetylase (PgdA/CDA1 family)
MIKKKSSREKIPGKKDGFRVNAFMALTVSFILLLMLGGSLWIYFFHTIKQNQFNEPFKSTVTQQPGNFTPTSDLKEVNVSTKTAVEISNTFGELISVPILTYHYVSNNPNPLDKTRDSLSVSPSDFENQMEYLYKNGFKAITLDLLIQAIEGEILLPQKPIILTFDDGYIDFYVNAYPILRRYNLNATAFISPGLIGQSPYIDWDQIKEMDRAGLISFQAHSVTHPDLTKLSDEKLKLEIEESKIMLQNFLGRPVNFFAYPFGYSNARVWKATKEAGFFGAVSTLSGRIITKSNFFNMPRIGASGNPSIENFAKIITP